MREIARLAVRQYRAWLALAETWEIYKDGEQMRCRACDIGVVSLYDGNGINRVYTREEIQSLVTGHLRNYHRDLESIVYKEAGVD